MVLIPSWMHSKFKELSNEYSHAQIRVKTKKLWPRQVGEKKTGCCQESISRQEGSMSRQAVCCDRCRDKQQYVATDVATSSTSRPVSRQESFVATRNLCRDQKRCRNKKKHKFDIFDQISSPFHPRTIYILVFLVKRQPGRLESLSHRVSLSRLPIFPVFH